MTFIQNWLRQREYGDYEPIAKFGVIYTAKIPDYMYWGYATLLKYASDWALRLDLIRSRDARNFPHFELLRAGRSGRTSGTGGNGGSSPRLVVDIHFRSLSELEEIFEQVRRDVRVHVKELEGYRFSKKNPRQNPFEKEVASMQAGRIVRQYSRIDGDSGKVPRQKCELFLSWDRTRHWLLFRKETNPVEWQKFPSELADTVIGLFPKIEVLMNESGEQS